MPLPPHVYQSFQHRLSGSTKKVTASRKLVMDSRHKLSQTETNLFYAEKCLSSSRLVLENLEAQRGLEQAPE